jgi:hypothetical protein
LAEKTFLNLWSYPNTFIDKRTGVNGHGKELCDLLVVCDDHVLIFSDKMIVWPEGNDPVMTWSRWFKRAVQKSMKQIRGAERWITTFPNRIFLDRECKQRLPLALPPAERRRVHGIVVARGAGEACRDFFGEGSGSFLIIPSIKDEHHYLGTPIPFAVGDIDSSGSFIHVLDDATLEIVMSELDTITDFTAYLQKKEMIIRSNKLLSAAGEDELVAYYMTHMNANQEHDFVAPDGSALCDDDHLSIGLGFYSAMLSNPHYRAKKIADESSYIWDGLIQAFTMHMLSGTTIVPDGSSSEWPDHEESVRRMALVPRYLRRGLGAGILDALQQGALAPRFTRGFLIGLETGFVFMTLARPQPDLPGGYEQYRSARRNMLESYVLAMLWNNKNLSRVVGLATEPYGGNGGSSEDLIMAEQPEWTPAIMKELKERKRKHRVFRTTRYLEYQIEDREFPLKPAERFLNSTGLTRAQRRAKGAEARRQGRRGKKLR